MTKNILNNRYNFSPILIHIRKYYVLVCLKPTYFMCLDLLRIFFPFQIDKYHILTAAHCVQDYHPKFFIVSIGDQNTEESTEPSQQFRMIEEIIMHPDYKHYRHDIAVIRLETPIEWTDYVQPICLPDSGGSEGDVDTIKRAYIAGWGNRWESPQGEPA